MNDLWADDATARVMCTQGKLNAERVVYYLILVGTLECTLCREEDVPMTTPLSKDHEASLGRAKLGSSTDATGSPLHRLLRALRMQGIASSSVDTALPPGHSISPALQSPRAFVNAWQITSDWHCQWQYMLHA